jgi:hypothetical protein
MRPTSIATGSRWPRSDIVSESTLARSARHVGERACRFARDAVGRAPEHGVTLPRTVGLRDALGQVKSDGRVNAPFRITRTRWRSATS